MGNTQNQSSQLAEPLWTDPGIKSGISKRELISTLNNNNNNNKKKKKAQAGTEWSNVRPNFFASENKDTTRQRQALMLAIILATRAKRICSHCFHELD